MNRGTAMIDIDREIDIWKSYIRSHGDFTDDELEELESHLRDEISALEHKSLTTEEAFIVALRRTGKVDAVAREFSKIHARTLWKQLMVDPVDPGERKKANREIGTVIILSLFSGALSRIPELFGIHLFEGDELFYVRNASVLIAPVIACYFLWKFGRSAKRVLTVFGSIGVAVFLTNLYPAYAETSYDLLIGIHQPILLWFVVGLLFIGTEWRDPDRRMDYLRFTGEAFIYLVLILCGGAVLAAMTTMLFSAISINLDIIVEQYIVVIGGAAAPVVAVYLAYAKKSIIENMAPVLARVFSPLFLVLLCAFLVTTAITGNTLTADRDILIGFDLLLAVTLAMLLYMISARDERLDPGAVDYIHAALILAALMVDIMALWAILGRIREFGFTPNKTAALGENVVLLVNLAGSFVLYVHFLIRRDGFRRLVIWQTSYLPAFLLWVGIVCFLFPVIFG